MRLPASHTPHLTAPLGTTVNCPSSSPPRVQNPNADDDLTIPLTPDQDLHLDLTLTATKHNPNPNPDTDTDGPVGVVLSVAVDSFRIEMEQGEVSVAGLPEPSMIAPRPEDA